MREQNPEENQNDLLDKLFSQLTTTNPSGGSEASSMTGANSFNSTEDNPRHQMMFRNFSNSAQLFEQTIEDQLCTMDEIVRLENLKNKQKWDLTDTAKIEILMRKITKSAEQLIELITKQAESTKWYGYDSTHRTVDMGRNQKMELLFGCLHTCGKRELLKNIDPKAINTLLKYYEQRHSGFQAEEDKDPNFTQALAKGISIELIALQKILEHQIENITKNNPR